MSVMEVLIDSKQHWKDLYRIFQEVSSEWKACMGGRELVRVPCLLQLLVIGCTYFVFIILLDVCFLV